MNKLYSIIPLLIFTICVNAQVNYGGMHFKKGVITLNDDTKISAYISWVFVQNQYLHYLTDTTQSEATYLAAKKIKEVEYQGEKYIRVSGIVGGLEQVRVVKHDTKLSDIPRYGVATVSGDWFVRVVHKDKLSLAETRFRLLHLNLLRRQKEKYVHGIILHLVEGDVANGDNYIEIVGGYKSRMKKLKKIFGEYPDIMDKVKNLDFSKSGYTQQTIDDFVEIVKLYNSKI